MADLIAQLPLLYVLRHGQTEWNLERRLQGTLDSPLTPLGRSQAAKQREILQTCLTGQEDWVTSPQGRAVATAEIARQGSDITLKTDARLREIEMGDWTGWTRDDIAKARPDLQDLALYTAMPGGERIADVTERLRAFLADRTGPTVIITHGITSRILRCLATGQGTDAFAEIGGGQGVVYRVEAGTQKLLS